MRLRSLRQPSTGYPSHQIATNPIKVLTARSKNEQFTLGCYDRQYIKIYSSDLAHMNFVDAMLKHFISNAFKHKKIDGIFLEHLDYSTVRLVNEFNGAIGRWQIKASLQRLHKMGFIHLGERPNTRRGIRSGRRIRPGVNFVKEDKYQSTMLISLDILKKYNASAAIYHALIRSHCPYFSDLVKTNPRAQSIYDVVSTDQINKVAERFLTPRQRREVRSMLIKGGDLQKIRSLNLVDGQRSKQYVYSTSMDALKEYSDSKFFNYRYPDSILTRINALGITFKEHLNLLKQKSHNPKNCRPRYVLSEKYNKKTSFNDFDDVDNNEMMFDHDSYCDLRKQEQQTRKQMAFNKYQSGHIQADLTKMPSTAEIIAIVKRKGGQQEHAFYIERIIRTKYFKNGRITLKNYVAFIISMVYKIKQNDGLPEHNATKHVGEPAPSFLSNNTTSHGDDTPTYLVPSQQPAQLVDVDTRMNDSVSEQARQENIRLMKEFMEKSKDRKKKEELSFGGMKPQGMK